MLSKAALAAATLAITANAHLFISSPMPISGSAPKDPLDPSGSNFPCHGVSLPSSGGEQMAAGSSQLLAFDNGGGANTAVHGGGSCQISITYETDPAKVKDPKNWKVLYSIEKGCPSNTYQNLDSTYTGPGGSYTGALDCSDPKSNGVDCINQFNFTIPSGVKNGHAIMAWTWFNNVGNRELYMNCINTQITGGDGSEDAEFPSMFVANLAGLQGGSCPTTESVNIKFPYAGKYVTTKEPSGPAAKTCSTFPIAVPTGAGCSGDGAPAGGSSGGSSGGGSPPPAQSYGGGSSAAPAPAPSASGGSGSPSSYAAPSGSGMVTVTTIESVTASASAAPSGGAGSYAGGSSAGGASSAAGGSYGGGSSAAAGSYGGGSSAAPAPSAAPSSSGSGSCSGGKVSCPSPGQVVCIGSSQFGICDIDNCAVPQSLASGTKCSGGMVAKRSHIRRHALRHGAGGALV